MSNKTKAYYAGMEVITVIEAVINTPKLGIDLTDIGSHIGEAIGKYISTESGFEYEDFISGLEHGVSLANGTH